MTDEQVIVIGAGPAGLASAYYLKKAGIAFKVLDRAHEIAHTWNSLYPSLHLNTSKWFSHMPDTPMPRHYPIFPTAKQYHAHVRDFVERHELMPYIHLGVDVQRVSQTDDGMWRVESSEGVDVVPVVISATGRFEQPYTPTIPGLDQFEGEVIHAKHYAGAERFGGKRVMVVGNGPSGVDIAPELGAQPDMPPVLMSMRTGVILRPRYPLGLPKHAWMIIGEHLPKWIGEPLVNAVGAIKFHNLEQVGIRTPAPDQESSAAATRGNELIEAVKSGQVMCVPGPKRFFGKCVELDDGSVHEIDVVIMATGYHPVLDSYLDTPPLERDKWGWPLRDQSNYTPDGRAGEGYPSDSGREVLGLPGLYLVGVFYQGRGAMYNFTVEGQIAVEQIQERLAAGITP